MILDPVISFFQGIIDSVPQEYRVLVSFVFYTLLILIYALFIWKFCKFLSRRDIFGINLKQYNNSENPQFEKLFAMLLYTVEFIVILPFLVLLWFTILSLFLLIFSGSPDVQQILLISAAIIVVTRITAYTNRNLSEELSKILPLNFLGIFLLNPNFSLSNLIGRFSQIPSLFNNILYFIIFIFISEFILRFLYSVTDYFASEEDVKKKKD